MKGSVILSLVASSILSLASAQEGTYKDNYEPSPYHYEYKVHDDKEYLDFGAEEEGDGKGDVHGQYHVQLPDGRLQHVSYHVDDYNGYIADVSYDGHAEHPSYHASQSDGGNHGHQHGGGHPFGKTLGKVEVGQSLNINEGEHRLGKTISTQSEDHITTKGFTNSRSGKTIGQESFHHKSNQVHAKPVQSFPSSGDFSQRFGEPSNTFSGSSGTFKTQFGKPSSGFSGSSGQFNSESEKPENSFFSRRPIKPQQSLVSKTKESFDIGVGSPVKTFSSFGQEPVKQENSYFSTRKVQPPAFPSSPLNAESTGSPPGTFVNKPIKQEHSFLNGGQFSSPSPVKDTFSRHGKSGRQDVDEHSSNLFGSSSHSKPVLHVESTNEKKDINTPKRIISKFGEPKTNNFFESVGGKSSKPDFDLFSPIFGKSSKNKDFRTQTKKSFDSFSPIFGKNPEGPKKFTSEPSKSDAGLFKPSASFSSSSDKAIKPSGSFKSSEAFKKPIGSSSFSTQPETFNSRSGKPNFPVRQQISPKLFTKQSPSSSEISEAKPAQSGPIFKARAIGFGNNHPVLKSIDRHRENIQNRSNGQRGSVDNQSVFGHQGSFRQQTDRRQFGRALFDEPVRQESPVQQKVQELESRNHGHKAFITHKAVPV